jgi:RecB family endonuclease NucS
MAAITEEQKDEIIALLETGGLTREQIASKVGVSPGTVSAIKAHITMGTYAGSAASDSETEELIEASETTFGLERDLQSALRANIEQLEPGLSIIDDGRERTTDAGRIDITAKDPQGAVVVIELKAGTGAPGALTQLLAYMGALATENSTAVRAIR